jgi:hypothetical protein
MKEVYEVVNEIVQMHLNKLARARAWAMQRTFTIVDGNAFAKEEMHD